MAEAGKKYIIRLIDRYTPTINKIAKSTEKFRRGILSLQGALVAAGGTMAFAGVLRPYLAFQKALNRTKATTQSTVDQMQILTDEAKRLGMTTQYTAVQVAQGMAELGTAGQSVEEIMGTMEGILNLAAAGNMDIAETAEAATDVMKQFGIGLKDFTHLTDVMTIGSIKASNKMVEVIEALRNVGSIAHMAGVSIEETVSLLMGMANAGQKGSEAGTYLMNAIRTTVNPTKQANKEFKKLHIQLKDFMEKGYLKDLTGLFRELKERKIDPGGLFRIFDIRGGRAVAALNTHLDAVEQFYKLLKKEEGVAKRTARTMMEGLQGEVTELLSSIEAVQIAVSEDMEKPLGKVIVMATNFLRMLAGPKGGVIMKIAAGMMLFAGALMAILIPIAALTLVITVMLTPLGLMITKIVAAVMLLATTIAGAWFAIQKISEFVGDWSTMGLTAAREKRQSEISGRIEVSAKKGTAIESAAIRGMGGGDNLAFLGG